VAQKQNTTKPINNNKLRKLEFMLEIRRMLVAGDSPREVQSKLGLPPRTFWRYINSIFEKDREVLRKINEDEVLTQAAILRDRYVSIYQTLDTISKDHTIDPEQRREACGDMAQVAKLIIKVYSEAPAFVAMQNRKREEEAARQLAERRQQEERRRLFAAEDGSKYDWHNTEYARNTVATSEEEEQEPEPEPEPEQDQQQQGVVRASSYNDNANNKEDLQQRLRRQQQEDEEAARRGWWMK
jgi:hypothetical protein